MSVAAALWWCVHACALMCTRRTVRALIVLYVQCHDIIMIMIMISSLQCR